MNKQQYVNLVKTIQKYNKAYYVDNKPIVTDEKYDKLYVELIEYENKHPKHIHLDSPSSTLDWVAGVNEKYTPHNNRMLSQQDIFSDEAFKIWYDKVIDTCNDKVTFLVEPKYDGLSINLQYIGGVLVDAVTRGDGEQGMSVLRNISNIRGVTKVVELKPPQEHVHTEIHGEVLMKYSTFNELNKKRAIMGKRPMANPRNGASGSLMMSDLTADKDRILYFQEWARFPRLRVPVTKVIKGYDNIMTAIRNIHMGRSKNDIPIDGVVIKVYQDKYRNMLGTTNKYPRWSCAYKFPAVEVQTKILNVTGQIGRTGNISPVAEVTPVDIDGSTVKYVTLHNYDLINKKGYRLRSNVVLIKSGDIIPKLIGVLPEDEPTHAIVPPTHCSVCTKALATDGINIRCENAECDGVLLARLTYFVSKECMNIDGLGRDILKKLMTHNLIRYPINIYHLSPDVLIDTIGDKNGTKLLANIASSRRVSMDKFIKSLGIHLIGSRAAKTILSTDVSILNPVLEELVTIPGIGEKMANSLCEFMSNNKTSVMELYNEMDIVNLDIQGTRYKDMKILLTGTYDVPRQSIVDDIESNGGSIVRSVSKQTSLLIYGTKPGGNKIDKARKLKVPMMAYEEYRKNNI